MDSDEARYLFITDDYVFPPGALRWSVGGEAIETGAGETFAFARQVWEFLEGFVAVRPPLHFAHLLHLLHLLGLGPLTRAASQGGELRRAFLLAGRPLRNAGVFCAQLCHDLADCMPGLDPIRLRQELLHRVPGPVHLAPEPPLSAVEFEAAVLRNLQRFTPEALLHWMKFGRAPSEAAASRVAEEIGRRPPNPEAALARAAEQRERLAGALALAPALNGALTLPPRRLDEHDLPVGGYADVTTRGEPERLLPTQYALESEEFIRRYAEHELLFFRREEPGRPTREELIVLLDQGVRTWGGVRLALAGAVFAFARLARRRGVPFRLAATSNQGAAIDPLASNLESLTQLLEAGDLTPGPAEALRAVLNEPSDVCRDVVVLTHPRSLAGADFSAAAALRQPADRLFAVSVDSEGRGRLDALRDGRPLPLTRFRVDLAAALDATVRRPRAPAAAAVSQPAWSGDVEPVPFPFWFGPVKDVRHLAFDQQDQWLLAATVGGLLHLQSIDNKRREVLPRGLLGGALLKEIEAVFGVNSGFVVCGRLERRAAAEPRLLPVAIHYDLHRRRARGTVLAATESKTLYWFYFKDLNSVGCRDGERIWALDLDTGARAPDARSLNDLESRARAAVARAAQPPMPVPFVSMALQFGYDTWYAFDPDSGRVEVYGDDEVIRAARPLADGRPVLRGARLVGVQHAETVIAVLAEAAEGVGRRLFVLDASKGNVVRELPLPGQNSFFRLSDDGRRIALYNPPHAASVYDTGSGSGPLTVMAPGRCHTNIEAELGPSALAVTIGQFRHVFRWSGDFTHVSKATAPSDATVFGPRRRQRSGAPLEHSPLTSYDPSRFHTRDLDRLRVEADRFGHVLVLDRAGERLIAMFWFRRDKAAAWMPDGTRWGAAEIVGTPTPGAGAKLGRALRS